METPATQRNVESDDMEVERRGGQGVRVARPISLACLCIVESLIRRHRASPRRKKDISIIPSGNNQRPEETCLLATFSYCAEQRVW
jgi:hypothetical protein